MKVLNLQCAHQHGFEGWFASEDDFTGQLARGLVSCPLCGDAQIQKMLSAPRLNLRAGREDKGVAVPSDAAGSVELGRSVPGSPLQAQLLKAMRQVLAQTEDVVNALPIRRAPCTTGRSTSATSAGVQRPRW